jgi:hypothetical protein
MNAKLTRVAAIILCAGVMCAGLPTAAAQLQKRTVEAFDRYVQETETRMEAELKAGHPFFWVDALPEAQRAALYARLRHGEVLVQELAAGKDLPGGMVHDWIALAYVPGATLPQALAQLQDYNEDYKVYAPEVIQSKLLQRDDGHYSVLLRLKKKSFVTVVLDLTNDVHYFSLDPSRAYSQSHSVRIVEIQDPDTPQEHEGQVGDDHGYLWRLYTYWRFWEKDGGVYLQCQAIALTRGIPFGLGWLIKPFVTKIPKESLVFTLTKARSAIEQQARTTAAFRDR